jgi:hypothetical protein
MLILATSPKCQPNPPNPPRALNYRDLGRAGCRANPPKGIGPAHALEGGLPAQGLKPALAKSLLNQGLGGLGASGAFFAQVGKILSER